MKNTDPENIDIPNPFRLKAELESYLSISDDEILQEMFAELITMSFLKSEKDMIHPSFSSVLKQLHPFEARLLNKISEEHPSLIIFDKFVDDFDDLYDEHNDPCYSFFANEVISLGISDDIYDRNLELAWNNLKRLQLIDAFHLTSTEHEKAYAIDSKIIPEQFIRHDQVKIAISDFGHDFLECVGSFKDI